MRIFLYEYTCASGAGAALQAEGRAMLRALSQDFAAIPGVETATILNAQSDLLASVNICRLHHGQEEKLFRELSGWADFTLVIAPEFDDILRMRALWVEEAGGCLLGSSTSSVLLAGDKWSLGERLQGDGIKTPKCWPIHDQESLVEVSYPVVWKPRFGAGSQATFLLRRPGDWDRYRADALAEGYSGETLLQRFVPGLAVSVAFLIGPRQTVPLLPALQLLSHDGRFRYLGGTSPLPDKLAERAIDLAARAANSVPGLLGYVGVDLVLGETDDWVIEINPRLTTSYVGLRALAKTNLAEAMLRIVGGMEVVQLSWREARVRFDTNGHVEVLSTE
jgi:predicted ATP-grasp superfamily ATP-dependent carboligase